MTSAIVMHATGGPDVLQWEPVEVAGMQAHEVLLRHTAVGVNYHDAYVRSGLYKTLALPGIPGIEAAGVVEAVGKDVQDFKAGDRVAYVTRQYGAYAERRVIAADLLVQLPDAVTDIAAASSLLKGLTAQMLVQRVYAVSEGDWVLVHAAAGGVGTLMCQWARHLGAKVIGTVGSAEKVPLAFAAGCHSVVRYREEDFVARVREITGGAGVQVAYDAVGKDTFFLVRWNAWRPLGTWRTTARRRARCRPSKCRCSFPNRIRFRAPASSSMYGRPSSCAMPPGVTSRLARKAPWTSRRPVACAARCREGACLAGGSFPPPSPGAAGRCELNAIAPASAWPCPPDNARLRPGLVFRAFTSR